MLKIAVIDDGVSTCKLKSLAFNLEINDKNEIVQRTNAVANNSHGTMCALIIKKYAPDALLGSIKILHTETKRGYVEQLKSAFNWCIKNSVTLINLSLGSVQTADYHLLYECVENAYRNRIIIVAALSNKHIVTYPASFPNVIGVKTDPSLKGSTYYMQLPCIEGADVVASSVHRINGKDTDICNSYAAPLITAKVNKLMKKRGFINAAEIKTVLNECSSNKIDNYNPAIDRQRLIENVDAINTKPVEIPCIVVKYKYQNKALLDLVIDLFIQSGFNTLLFSTHLCEGKHGGWVIPPERLNNKTIAYIASKHEADVIVIGMSENDKNLTAPITCDIIFYEEKDSNLDSSDEKEFFFGTKYEMKIGYMSNNAASFIYQKAIEYLA